MIIAFPPCTYLSNAGACRMFKRIDGDSDEWRLINLERLKLGMKGRDFFMAMLNADCEHIAVENPIPLSIYCLPDYAQIIHPYYFGEPYKKKTCLWLKGLPQLKKDNEVEPDMNWVTGGSKKPDGTARDIKTHGFRDAKNRSKTFVCVANAMARQ